MPAALSSGTAARAVSEPAGPMTAVTCGSAIASRIATADSRAPSRPPGAPSSIEMKLIAYGPAVPRAS